MADGARRLGSHTLWLRLVLVGLSGAVPLFVVALVLIGRVYSTAIDFGVQERRGIAFQRRLVRVLETVGRHSSVVADELSGRTPGTPATATAREAALALEHLAQDYHGELGGALGVTRGQSGSSDTLSALQRDWTMLERSQASGAALAENTANVVFTLSTLIERTRDSSNLILDDDLDSYYVMHLGLVGLPEAEKRLVVLEASLPAEHAAPSAPRERAATVLVTELRGIAAGVARDAESALRHDAAFNGTSASLQARLRPAVVRYGQAMGRFTSLLEQWGQGSASSASLAIACADARNASFELSGASLDELDRLLVVRIGSLEGKRQRAYAFVVAALLASIVLMGWLMRSLVAAREAEVASSRVELSGKEEQLRALGDNLPGGMTYQVLREPDGSMRFLYVSAGVEALHGVSADAVLADARVLYEAVVEEDRGALQAAERRSLEQMVPFRMTARSRRPDGTVRWFEFASAPRALPNGRVVWDGIQMDITERHLAEATSRQLEQRFSHIFDHSPIPIALISTADDRFVAVNDSFLTFSDGTREQILGRTAVELGVYANAEQRAAVRGRLQADGRVAGIEVDFRTLSGRVRKNLLWLEQMSVDGQGFLLAMSIDTTEQFDAERHQRELEEQLRQTQKLEALGTLAGGIAHDFNNILGAVITFAELAKLDRPDDAELHENLDQILQASGRATVLVRQILSFSRRQKEERINVQLGPIVKEALSLLRATLPATIAIEQTLPAPMPDVMANATQVHQIVMNLCTNAAHAMKGGQGSLKVALAEVGLRAGAALPHVDLRPGTYVRLTISDTGHGMDAATVSRIFEPFFTTKGAGEGTGLGLSVVHGIVKEYGGAVTVESALGRGTTFCIYLPAVSGRSEQAVVTDAEIPRGRGERVLLVDDEKQLGDAVARMIERLGYVPAQFRSPAAALAEFGRAPAEYSVLVTDYTMPELTGVELARAVRAIRADMPVIITSGSSGGLSELELSGLGVSALLNKPVSLVTLATALRRTIPA